MKNKNDVESVMAPQNPSIHEVLLNKLLDYTAINPHNKNTDVAYHLYNIIQHCHPKDIDKCIVNIIDYLIKENNTLKNEVLDLHMNMSAPVKIIIKEPNQILMPLLKN